MVGAPLAAPRPRARLAARRLPLGARPRSRRDARLERERSAADERVELLERTQEQWEERFKAVAGRGAVEEPVLAARAHRGEARTDQGDPPAVRDPVEGARGPAAARGRDGQRATAGSRRGPGTAPLGDGQPGDRAPGSPRSRQLGRGAAEAGGRARGDGRLLRLPHPGDRARRRGPAAAARPGGQAPRRQEHRRRLQGADRRLPRRRQLRRRRDASGSTSHGTPPSFATTSASSARSATGASSTRRPSSW